MVLLYSSINYRIRGHMNPFSKEVLEAMSKQVEAVASSKVFSGEVLAKAKKAQEALGVLEDFSLSLEELQGALRAFDTKPVLTPRPVIGAEMEEIQKKAEAIRASSPGQHNNYGLIRGPR